MHEFNTQKLNTQKTYKPINWWGVHKYEEKAEDRNRKSNSSK